MNVKNTSASAPVAPGATAVQSVLFGVAWEQQLKAGKSAGKTFQTLKLDRGTTVTIKRAGKEYELTSEDVIFAYPNQSAREGRRDPQFRLAIQVPA